MLTGSLDAQQVGSVAIHGGLPFVEVPFKPDSLLSYVVTAVFRKASHRAMSLFEMAMRRSMNEFDVLEAAACDASLEFDQIAHGP